jgi:hypothetical protein
MGFLRWSLLVSAFVLVGCGGQQPTPPPEEIPLTVEEWKKLPTQAKFEIETFERLKRGDPKLMDQRTWDKLYREVILPSKRKEMPGVK